MKTKEDSRFLSSLKSLDWISMGYSGIWLVFLVFPFFAIVDDSSLVLTQKVTGISALFLFCFIYLYSFGNNNVIPAKTHWQRSLIWSGLLLIPVVILYLFVGPITFYLGTYFVAKWAFQNPANVGIPIGIGITVLCALLIFAMFPPEIRASGAGFIIGAIFVLIMAFITSRVEQKEKVKIQLLQAEASQKIARDVHDLLGHSLTVINLKAEVASALIDSDSKRAQDELQQISMLSRTALAEVRATVTRINTPTFAGEIEATSKALSTAGIDSTMPSTAEIQEVGVNAALFTWVLREAVTNILRHSNATSCTVRVSPTRIEIMDDGPTQSIKKGSGLTGLENRVKEAGGDMLLETQPKTRLLVTMNGDFSPMKADS